MRSSALRSRRIACGCDLGVPACVHLALSSGPTACIQTFATSLSGRSNSLKRTSVIWSRRSRREDRPRDEDVYVTYSDPGRMVARVALRDDRTLILFVFTRDDDPLPTALGLAAQKAMLRERFGGAGWECAAILGSLDSPRTSISIGSPKSRCLPGRAAAWRLSATPRSASRCWPGKAPPFRWSPPTCLPGSSPKPADGTMTRSRVRGAAHRLYRRKAKGRRAFLRGLCAEDPVWTVPAQSNHQGVRRSGAGEIGIEQGH